MRLLAVMLAGAAVAAGTAVAAAPSYVGMAPYVEHARADWDVPGVAVGIVDDGEVALLRGFGVREMGRSEAVDPDTLFPIASLSKGFTAAVVAALVTDGTLGWDDRVMDRLPGFAVADPWITREMTLRDLLAHRTGWPETLDWLWLGGLGPDEIVARLRQAPSEGFRTGVAYQNVGYLVAGEAAARAAGKPWGDLLRERLFVPLGMTRTYPTFAAARGASNRVSPHSDLGGPMHVVPADETADAIAPAAGILSTARDLLRWIEVQLGAGRIGDTVLWGDAAAAELHGAQNPLPASPWFRDLYPESNLRAFALGWVVQDYRGRTVVWNTGGLGSSSCSIALVPAERFGVIVLANAPRTSFPEALVWRAIDTALGAPDKDWSEIRLKQSLEFRERAEHARLAKEETPIPDTRPSLPPERYAGTYRDALLGDVRVRFDDGGDGAGRLAFHGISGRLEHRDFDTFLVRWDDAAYGTALATFVLDADGTPARIMIEDAATFERVEPAAAGGP